MATLWPLGPYKGPLRPFIPPEKRARDGEGEGGGSFTGVGWIFFFLSRMAFFSGVGYCHKGPL